MSKLIYIASLLLAGSAIAQLEKPTLEPNLDYLEQGMIDHLNPTHSTWDQWGAGWIPADCKAMTEDAGLNPEDVSTYNVHYDDCSEAWVLCYHNQSPSPLINLIDLFGRLPVSMRSWVRHVIALPSPTGGHAYNSNGNIAMFDLLNSVDVFVHEAGHSLDLLGAYPSNGDDGTFHSSSVWMDNYNQDAMVPDPYAQTNIVEDVAQVTVVGVYDKVVPNGFGAVEPNWNDVFHQYATLQWQAGGLILPGGTCSARLTNSAPVPQSGSSRLKRMAARPDVSLSDKVKVIDVSKVKEFHTGDDCKMTW